MMMEIQRFDKEDCLLIFHEESVLQNNAYSYPSKIMYVCVYVVREVSPMKFFLAGLTHQSSIGTC